MTEREEENKRDGADSTISDEALKNKSFKEEIDDRLLHTLSESKRVEEAIEKIIERYIKSNWHSLLIKVVITVFALVGAIASVVKAFSTFT